MYSPKISEDLIPYLYKKSKEKKIPMTIVVDKIIRKSFKKGGLNVRNNSKGNGY